MTKRLRYPVALAFAGMVLAAGCTADAEPESASEEATASTVGDEIADDADGVGSNADSASDAAGEVRVSFESPDADDFNLPLESEENLQSLQPIEILDIDQAKADDGRLVLIFEMESHKCLGVQVTVDEGEHDVVIGLQSGLRPGVRSSDCVYGVFPYTTEVELDGPLGDRILSPAEPLEPSERVDDTANEAATDDRSDDADSAAPAPDTTSDTGSGGTSSSDTTTSSDADPADGAVEDEEPDPKVEVDGFVGQHIEDGVEWAINGDIEWRVLSFDGVELDVDGSVDPDRISFVVERDLIVTYEWS